MFEFWFHLQLLLLAIPLIGYHQTCPPPRLGYSNFADFVPLQLRWQTQPCFFQNALGCSDITCYHWAIVSPRGTKVSIIAHQTTIFLQDCMPSCAHKWGFCNNPFKSFTFANWAAVHCSLHIFLLCWGHSRSNYSTSDQNICAVSWKVRPPGNWRWICVETTPFRCSFQSPNSPGETWLFEFTI